MLNCKLLTVVLFIFIFNDRGGLPKCCSFFTRIYSKFFKIQTFVKNGTKNAFSAMLQKLTGSRHLKTFVIFFLSSKGARCTPAGFQSFLQLKFCQFFAHLISIIIQNPLFIFDKTKKLV